MKVIDAVKNTAFTTAINSGLKYLEKDPEVNIPKLMSLVASGSAYRSFHNKLSYERGGSDGGEPDENPGSG